MFLVHILCLDIKNSETQILFKTLSTLIFDDFVSLFRKMACFLHKKTDVQPYDFLPRFIVGRTGLSFCLF